MVLGVIRMRLQFCEFTFANREHIQMAHIYIIYNSQILLYHIISMLPCSDNVPESTSTHLNQTSSKAIAHGGAHIKTSITKTGEGNNDRITLVSTQF